MDEYAHELAGIAQIIFNLALQVSKLQGKLQLHEETSNEHTPPPQTFEIGNTIVVDKPTPKLYHINAALSGLCERLNGVQSPPRDETCVEIDLSNAQPRADAVNLNNLIQTKSTNAESINSTKESNEFMEYGGYKVSRRADGRWFARVPVNGQRINIYGKSQKECHAKLRNFIKENKKSSNQITPKKTKLYDWLDKWLEIYKRPKLKPKSLYQITLCIKNHIKPHIKNIELDKLSAIDIETALSKIQSGRMKKYTYDCYCDSLRHAYKNRLIRENLSDFIETVTHKREHGTALTEEQRSILIKHGAQLPHGDIFLFYLFSGARKSELLGLKWEHIDKETLFIPGTKTDNAPRRLPLFEQLQKIIDRVERKTEFVFPFSDSTLKRTTEKLSELCGFPIKIKDLRTTFATMCYEKGIKDTLVSKWLGHSRTSTTKQFYVRVLDEYENEQKTLFNNSFSVNFDTKTDTKNPPKQ